MRPTKTDAGVNEATVALDELKNLEALQLGPE
jgi:hypothetical protein